MADVTIEANAQSGLSNIAARAGPFWVSTTVGYVIYVDSVFDLKYRKTVDGGANWGSAVNIVTGTIRSYDCWADWQTAGDAGTKIHIIYADSSVAEVRYVYLDTDGDSVGGDDLIEASQGSGLKAAASWTNYNISITKTRGGNLAVSLRYQDGGGTPYYAFYTSPDGATWTEKDSPWEADTNDYFEIYPANLADNQDIWGVFWDTSASEISLKTYDDSGNSWSEQSISGGMTRYWDGLNMSGVIRLSDGHLVFAAWSQYDNADADLMVWDINGAGSITAKANVITNTQEYFLVSVFVDQDSDDIYVSYLGGTAARLTVDALYQLSQNGGANWDGEVILSDDAQDDHRWISAGAVKAAWGGFFMPIWFDDDDNDIFCSTANAVSIAAAAVGGETYIRSGTALIGLAPSATRARIAVRSDLALLGLLPTTLRTIALSRADTTLLGLLAAGNRAIDYTAKVATALLGLKATASREVSYSRTNTALLGLKTTAIRVLSLNRVKVALLGLKTTASKAVAYTRLNTALLGLKATATRVIVIVRAATAILGFETTGTGITAYIFAATAYLGLKATVTRTIILTRAKTALLGLKPTGVRVLSLTRADDVLLGLKAIATRVIIMTRTDTVLLGLKVTGIKIRVYVKSATAFLGLDTTGVRIRIYTRTATALLGLLTTGLRIRIVSRIRRIILGYTLGKMKTTAYSLGRSFIDYTLGGKRR